MHAGYTKQWIKIGFFRDKTGRLENLPGFNFTDIWLDFVGEQQFVNKRYVILNTIDMLIIFL